MERKILGKREQGLLTDIIQERAMPRGKIMKYEVLSRIYRLKEELNGRELPRKDKKVADEYLNKLLEYVSSFSY